MKIIACYSNKGGVGKTAASVNLAYVCAGLGWRTLLCDLDPQGASGFYFRVKPSKSLKKKTFFRDEQTVIEAIRASDYEDLDLLPANLGFRDFDIFLSGVKKSRIQLKNTLDGLASDYDVILLDCPPNISLLSENVFRAANLVVVPVIPTTLSMRSLDQLHAFFEKRGYSKKKILPFFSMVQKGKNLHKDTIAELSDKYRRMCKTQIDFSTDIERMGLHREPAMAFAGKKSPASAYIDLWLEIEESAGLR